MKRHSSVSWMLLTMLVASVVTWYCLFLLVTNPERCVHELGGDGIKNYYSYIYHSMYGRGWWFDGMNYPYGEHIMFVDGQPILTLTLSYLRNWISFTPETLTAVLNLLIVFTFFLAIIYVYKLLLKFKVTNILAIVFACIIVVMSTQNFRIFGLYGLCYPCVVPMLFYWFVCYYESGRKKYMIFVFLLSCIVMFLHAYQLALVLVWSGLYIAGYWLITTLPAKEKLRHIIPVALVVICSMIVIKSVLAITDPVTDRPEYPHGLLSYGTTGEDIFKSTYSPYWMLLQEKGIIAAMPPENKGYAYTGVVPIVVLCITMLLFIFKIIKRKRNETDVLRYGFQPLWLFIAAGALLYSMGVPFVWGMEWLFDYIASFRQFRSLGWFALLFYYVATIFSAVLLYRLFSYFISQKKLWAAVAILFIPMSVWAYEAYGFAGELRKRGSGGIFNYNTFYSKIEKDWDTLLAEHNFTSADFQGIINIPYYHVGSEKIWLSRSDWGVSVAMRAAFQLHLPLIDANMSRSSWTQTFKQVKITGGPYTYKSLLYNVKDKRPYLLMRFASEELNPDEQHVFDNADSLGTLSDMITYVLYPDKLKESDERARERIIEIGKSMSIGDTAIPGGDKYYNHYDTAHNIQIFFGAGAAQAVTDKDIIIAKIPVSAWEKTIQYEASAWFLVNDNNYKFPEIEMTFFDSIGTVLDVKHIVAGESTDNNKFWFRSSSFFHLPENTATIVLVVKGKGKGVYDALDEILIRQADDTVISKDSKGRIMVNNHLFK